MRGGSLNYTLRTAVFTAHHRLIVRKPSIRQILECLLDFVVLQFDTPLECKKAGISY